MTATTEALRHHAAALAAADAWTYRASPRSMAEPAGWTALALAAHGEAEAAARPADWLAKLQQANGSVGISAVDAEPRWPTALAILAWTAVDRLREAPRHADNVERAVAWSLQDRGKTAPQTPEVGHDTTIAGWSWAAATHSWLEPTAMFVLALRAGGVGNHQRVRDGVRLLRDRLLAEGGANYGNTTVFGQTLLPHIEPTGMAMLALAGEEEADGRIEKSLKYLEACVGPNLALESLSYAVLGLTAHGRRPSEATAWIVDRLAKVGDLPAAVYDRALLLLAARPNPDWLAPGGAGLNAQATRTSA